MAHRDPPVEVQRPGVDGRAPGPTARSAEKDEGNLEVLVAIRGIASLLVCCSHLGSPTDTMPVIAGLFRILEQFWEYAYHALFIISGFVISLSLSRGRYEVGAYGRFLIKRAARLYPPYLAALILTLVISYFSYKVRGVAYGETPASIALSLVLAHIPEDNPVYWSLVAEAQYYLFIGLAFPLLIRYPRAALLCAVPLLLVGCHSLEFTRIGLCHFMNFLLIGIICFMIHERRTPLWICVCSLAMAFSTALLWDDFAAFAVSLVAVASILFWRLPISRMVKFFGTISYSLFLIHYPIGVKFVNLSMRYLAPEWSGMVFVAALIVCLACAYCFHRLVEVPAMKLASRVRYWPAAKPLPGAAQPLEPAMAVVPTSSIPAESGSRLLDNASRAE